MIQKEIYDVCIAGGCGHIGLPLAIALALKGKNVCIFDINTEAIKSIEKGTMPFKEVNGDARLQEALCKGKLHLSDDLRVITVSNILIIAIDTPLDKYHNPNRSQLKAFFKDHINHFTQNQLIILRSTVYPGTSAWLYQWLVDRRNDLHLAFCPERILEGKSLEELETLPQIVASFSEEGLKRSIELFQTLTPDIVVLEPLEAELMKLYTNAWRYITFSVANRFFIIANDFGVDYYKIHQAMTHNYPRAQSIPKPGLSGGPCLLKDTIQLAASNNSLAYLEQAAININEGMPDYIVTKLQAHNDLSAMTVGILGMAFKGDHDNPNGSLSYKLKKILEFKAKNVLCTDPYVKDESLVPLEQVITESDILIIAAPHTIYKEISIKHPKVIDIWNILGKGALIE